MRKRHLLPLLLAPLAAGCDRTLSVEPKTEVAEQTAITDATGARAALAGVYSAMETDSYYGTDFYVFGDLSADNAEHSGTYASWADADQNNLRADNDDVTLMWEQAYITIGRANVLLARLPGVEDPALSEEEKNEILGEAHFIRALSYHNLVKYWGAVPLRLEPPTDLNEAASVERSPVEAVYAQILADLDQAEDLISVDQASTTASLGAVRALRSRVLLYQQDWQGTIDAANAVEAMGYDLTSDYGDLFVDEGTDEDIFKVQFTPQQYQDVSYYYLAKGDPGGRYEAAPTQDLMDAYEAGDLRKDVTIATFSGDPYVAKFSDSEGSSDLHVIRFAEVLLNEAEAQAQLGDLSGAVATMNRIRERAGLADYVLGTHTQDEVLAAIEHERRIELAFEGDRWPDLVRRGQAVAVMGLQGKEFQALYPIPLREVDVTSPPLEQNPGY
jgi:hypothetical protein